MVRDDLAMRSEHPHPGWSASPFSLKPSWSLSGTWTDAGVPTPLTITTDGAPGLVESADLPERCAQAGAWPKRPVSRRAAADLALKERIVAMVLPRKSGLGMLSSSIPCDGRAQRHHPYMAFSSHHSFFQNKPNQMAYLSLCHFLSSTHIPNQP